VSGYDIGRIEPIPPHANNQSKLSARERADALRFDLAHPRTRRLEAYLELVRIDIAGLESCPGGCGALPLWRCEHHEVEHRLERDVDARHPDDHAIAIALRVIAEFRDDEGIDYEQRHPRRGHRRSHRPR
jgi:hypothetical protein